MTRLGRSDISYDALRLATLSAPNAGGGNSGNNAAIGNSIYVWHADGSAVDQFEPTNTGLLLAIATIRGDDTIWIPSIRIELTAAITMPAGSSLVGINREQSILSFTGFNGTAITLGIDAAAANLTVIFVNSSTTAYVISATASGSVVERVTISVSGGSVFNLGIMGGT